jgi:hypothetical protein
MTTMIDNKVMAEVEETLRRTPGKTVVEAPYMAPEEEKSGILDYGHGSAENRRGLDIPLGIPGQDFRSGVRH